MLREEEIIKKIDEHIQKTGGIYYLQISVSDLQVIHAALEKQIPKQPVWDKYGELFINGIKSGELTRMICPACREPINDKTQRCTCGQL